MKTLHSLIACLRPASSILARRIAFPLLFLGAGIVLAQPCADAPFEFEETGSLATTRQSRTATLLPNDKVLVTGDNRFAGAELYDPASGTWAVTASLATARADHTATLLSNGRILAAGGLDSSFSTLASAELYNVGLGFSSAWQPKISTLRITDGERLLLTGSRFRGISQASGGNTQDSSSNYPIVQLRSLDNSEVVFLPVDPARGWSNRHFTSLPVIGFPHGPALVTVFTNGIQSAAKYLVVGKP